MSVVPLGRYVEFGSKGELVSVVELAKKIEIMEWTLEIDCFATLN